MNSHIDIVFFFAAAMRVHFKTKCRQQKSIREGTSAELLRMQRVRTHLNTMI